jgi:SAM-dependent methyltransferase
MDRSAEQLPRFNLTRRENWRRVDESNDGNFYDRPRLVVHVDDYFIATLGRFLAETLPPQAVILDLMSSYKSHLPVNYQAAKVTGLGLNEAELKANQQLTDYVIHNLNKQPQLPFEDNTFDVVLNTVSVQYLLHPVEVFREVGRVLKSGGLHIVSFSNRMFPTKAVEIWRELDEAQRVFLVMQYFNDSGAFAAPEVFTDIDRPGGRKWSAFFGGHDPVYIVWSRKKA